MIYEILTYVLRALNLSKVYIPRSYNVDNNVTVSEEGSCCLNRSDLREYCLLAFSEDNTLFLNNVAIVKLYVVTSDNYECPNHCY